MKPTSDPLLPRELSALIAQFEILAKQAGYKLGYTAKTAAGTCQIIENEFSHFARMNRVKAVSVSVCHPLQPLRGVFCPVKSLLIPRITHCFSWLPQYNVGIDFTIRQFWPSYGHPHIWTRSNLVTHWKYRIRIDDDKFSTSSVRTIGARSHASARHRS